MKDTTHPFPLRLNPWSSKESNTSNGTLYKNTDQSHEKAYYWVTAIRNPMTLNHSPGSGQCLKHQTSAPRLRFWMIDLVTMWNALEIASGRTRIARIHISLYGVDWRIRNWTPPLHRNGGKGRGALRWRWRLLRAINYHIEKERSNCSLHHFFFQLLSARK